MPDNSLTSNKFHFSTVEDESRRSMFEEKVPSELKREHDWRTRPDPFEAVWPEIEALLERDAGLQAKTVFEELCRRYPASTSTPPCTRARVMRVITRAREGRPPARGAIAWVVVASLIG